MYLFAINLFFVAFFAFLHAQAGIKCKLCFSDMFCLTITEHLLTETVVQRFSVIKLPRPATLLKKRLWHRCFPVNFVKFLRTPFLTEHLRWLLLLCQYCIYNLFYALSSVPISPDPESLRHRLEMNYTFFSHKQQVNWAQPSLFLAFQNFQH